jgi:hypothetical protein
MKLSLTISSLPEMAGGWGNKLMRNEMEFLVLDGMYVEHRALSHMHR